MRRVLAPVLLVALAAGLLNGGVRPAETVLLAVLALGGVAAAWAWRRPGAQALAPPPVWLEAAVVAGVVAAFAVSVAVLPSADQPMGDGWMRYLRNAVVLQEHEWGRWQQWRAPLHAWICLRLAGPAGGLVEANQWVSAVSVTLSLPLSWWIGRRAVGRWPALVGLGILAGWADLRVLALQTIPYPLLTLFLLAAVVCAAEALLGHAGAPAPGAERRRADRRPYPWALGAGVFMGLAWGTDLRGSALTAALCGLAVLACAHPRVRWRGLVVAGCIAVVAVPLSMVLLGLVEVELFSLQEQVKLQRNLNAQAMGAVCAVDVERMPVITDLVSACAAATLRSNVVRVGAASIVSLPFWLLLGGAGAVAHALQPPAPGPPGRVDPGPWSLALLVVPVLPFVPSLAMVPTHHRYVLCMVPFVVPVLGRGLVACMDRVPRGVAVGWLALVVVALAACWQVSDHTLLARVQGRAASDQPTSVVFGQEAYAHLRRDLRAQLAPGDRVLDCAHAGMEMRLYPADVEEPPTGSSARVCARWVAAPPDPERRTWLLVPLDHARDVDPGWVLQQTVDAKGMALGLYLGSPAATAPGRTGPASPP